MKDFEKKFKMEALRCFRWMLVLVVAYIGAYTAYWLTGTGKPGIGLVGVWVGLIIVVERPWRKR